MPTSPRINVRDSPRLLAALEQVQINEVRTLSSAVVALLTKGLTNAGYLVEELAPREVPNGKSGKKS